MAINLDKLQRWNKAPLNIVRPMELEKALPVQMSQAQLDAELRKIGDIIERMADPDIFVWLGRIEPTSDDALRQRAMDIFDRLMERFPGQSQHVLEEWDRR